jgi:hypothetical protein
LSMRASRLLHAVKTVQSRILISSLRDLGAASVGHRSSD